MPRVTTARFEDPVVESCISRNLFVPTSGDVRPQAGTPTVHVDVVVMGGDLSISATLLRAAAAYRVPRRTSYCSTNNELSCDFCCFVFREYGTYDIFELLQMVLFQNIIFQVR